MFSFDVIFDESEDFAGTTYGRINFFAVFTRQFFHDKSTEIE
ncbi:MAG: hypothetical protein ACI8RD_002866 [Bacillariaceae sp.]|jgi:hypothetical protein